jgi:UDP-N-acetylglucosamine 2-epimerase
VVGNSSSGIYEAPYLKTPTVNIGPRQLGRAAPASVINCAPNKDEIADAILAAMAFKFDGVEMLYGSGNAAERIFLKLKEVVGAPGLTVKAFHDLQVAQ